MKRFREHNEKRNNELYAVASSLLSSGAVKQHKGIFLQRSSVDYFRGVNWHVAILSNEAKILKMIPTIIKDGDVS